MSFPKLLTISSVTEPHEHQYINASIIKWFTFSVDNLTYTLHVQYYWKPSIPLFYSKYITKICNNKIQQ